MVVIVGLTSLQRRIYTRILEGAFLDNFKDLFVLMAQIRHIPTPLPSTIDTMFHSTTPIAINSHNLFSLLKYSLQFVEILMNQQRPINVTYNNVRSIREWCLNNYRLFELACKMLRGDQRIENWMMDSRTWLYHDDMVIIMMAYRAVTSAAFDYCAPDLYNILVDFKHINNFNVER